MLLRRDNYFSFQHCGNFCCFAIFVTGVISSCTEPSVLTLQFIIDYGNMRKWDQMVIFDGLSTNCSLDYARPLIECLGRKGIKTSLQTGSGSKLVNALKIQRHRVAAVVLLDRLNFTDSENILNVASNKLLFNYYISWLMVTTNEASTVIDAVLRDLKIGIDSDIVVASSFLSPNEDADLVHHFKNKTCSFLLKYRRYNQMKNSKIAADDRPSVKTNLEYVTFENKTMAFYLVHVYKIRRNENTSMLVDALGAWDPETQLLRTPLGVKLRTNFYGFPIKVGIHNGTKDVKTELISNEESNDIMPLLDFMTIIANSCNTTIEVTAFEKIGTVTNKAWSDLLGEVVSGNIDIGVGYITISTERQQDMTFSYPLVKSMRNVYYAPPFYGTMRDIFLQPFNNRLLLCVAGTIIIIVASMEATNYFMKSVLRNVQEREAGLGEATLWCLSIICMQGSSWTPKTLSGKTVLLCSLFFALVIYNAYSGFITSILSVQHNGIKTLDDLLQYKSFKLGYSINEDEYIRVTNDTNLRKLYIKAYDNRESRLETVVGIEKAIKGNYGFFVGAADARKILQKALIPNQCSLKELQIEKTFSFVALPMAHTCPYKKIINLRVFRNLENGILDRVKEQMLPEMPKCTDNSSFNSASLVDVYTAFGVLFVGMVTSLGLCILERLWNKKTIVQEQIIRSIHVHWRDNHGRHSEQTDHQISSQNESSLRKPPSALAITTSDHLDRNLPLGHSQIQLSRKRRKIRQDEILNNQANQDSNRIIPFQL